MTILPGWQDMAKAVDDSASIDIRFAAAQLHLAQVELEYSVGLNATTPGIYTSNFIAELKARVDIA
jgi:hypothetical protein